MRALLTILIQSKVSYLPKLPEVLSVVAPPKISNKEPAKPKNIPAAFFKVIFSFNNK